MSGIRNIFRKKKEKQVNLFIHGELAAMGKGDPSGLPGTKGVNNGR